MKRKLLVISTPLHYEQGRLQWVIISECHQESSKGRSPLILIILEDYEILQYIFKLIDKEKFHRLLFYTILIFFYPDRNVNYRKFLQIKYFYTFFTSFM